METFNIRHSGLDPESRLSFWIPAFAGMTTVILANIYTTFRSTFQFDTLVTNLKIRFPVILAEPGRAPESRGVAPADPFGIFPEGPAAIAKFVSYLTGVPVRREKSLAF